MEVERSRHPCSGRKPQLTVKSQQFTLIDRVNGILYRRRVGRVRANIRRRRCLQAAQMDVIRTNLHAWPLLRLIGHPRALLYTSRSCRMNPHPQSLDFPTSAVSLLAKGRVWTAYLFPALL